MANHTVKVLREMNWNSEASVIEIDGIETTVYIKTMQCPKRLKLSFGSAGPFGYRIRFSNKLITQYPDYKNIRKYVLAAVYPYGNYWKKEHERLQSIKKQSNRSRVV